MADEIMKASPDDAAAIAALVNGSYRGEQAKKGWTTEAGFLEGTRIDEAGVKTLISKADTYVFKCVREHKIVGCVELRIEEKSAYFGMLSVEPMLQGGGVGKKLMGECEEQARQLGCDTIYMHVISVRHELIAWYERHGYRDTGLRTPFDKATPIDTNASYFFARFEKQL